MRIAAFVGVDGAVREAVGGVRLMAVAAPAVVDQLNVRAFPSIAVPDIPPIASMVPVVARGFRRSRPEATVHRISSVTSEPLTVPVTVQSKVGAPSTKPVPATAPVTLLLLVIVIEWTYVSPTQSPPVHSNATVYAPARFHDGRAAATLAGQMSAIAKTAAAMALFI